MFLHSFFRVPAFLAALLVLVLPPAALRAEGDLVDGVAAIVNGDVITLSQVRELVAVRERALRGSLRGQELIDKVKEARLASLKDLIDRQLILQDFKKQGFNIPDRVIEQRINDLVKEEFGGDRKAFVNMLLAQSYTLQKFRDLEKDKVIVQAMRQKYASPNLVVSPQRVEAFYQANAAKYSTPEQVKMRMIVLGATPTEPGATAQSQRTIAEEIRTKLVGGADFARMAEMYSEDGTRETGGDWGWIEKGTLNEDLTKAAFKLKAGEISPLVELGGNFYIITVEARKNSTTRPLAELRPEIEKELLQEERIKQMDKWVDTLRAKAFIKMF